MSTELRRFVWKFYAFRLCSSMAFFSSVVTVFFTEYARLTLWQAQLIQAWFMVWIVLSEIPSGVYADAFGRRRAMLTGSALTTTGVLVYGLAPSMEVFLLAEFLLAIGLGFLSGADTAMLRGTLSLHDASDQYGRAVRVGRMISLLGISIGALCGGAIVQLWGYAAAMWMTALPYAIAGLLLVTVKELKVERKAAYLQVLREGLLVFRDSRNLRRMSANMLVVSSAAYFVIWYYQILLVRVGVPVVYFGGVHVLLTVMQIGVLALYNRLVAKGLNRATVWQGAALLTTIGFLFGLVDQLWAVLMFVVLAGGFGLSRSETMAEELAELVPENRHATVLSVISMLRRAAGAVLNVVIGVIASYSLSAALVCLSLLACSALVIGLPSTRRKEE